MGGGAVGAILVPTGIIDVGANSPVPPSVLTFVLTTEDTKKSCMD